jgi:hypothetical protein
LKALDAAKKENEDLKRKIDTAVGDSSKTVDFIKLD